MKAADAAGLVTAGAGDIVQPPGKAAERADVLQRRSVARRSFQSGNNIAFTEDRVAPLAFVEAEFRQQV